jgi:murein DD-endopeptidase MepM/ murein hydrolase activator NlpD
MAAVIVTGPLNGSPGHRRTLLGKNASGRVASVVALGLVVALAVFLTIGGAPITAQPEPLGTPTFTATPTATYTPTSTPTPTWTPSPTPTPTITPTPTSTPTPTPSPTVATPTPAPASSHLWLDIPIGPDSGGDRYPGTYFPYGSTGGGRYYLHHGVDYMNPAGTPVLASAAGTIVVAGNDLETVYGLEPDFYGNLVIEELDQRFQGQPVYLLYAHLSATTIEAGQHVEPGDVVGLVGMTGVAVGNHLHLEVRLGANNYDSTRNPVLWLRPEPDQGIIAGLLVNAKGRPVPEAPITFFRAAEPNKWWRQTQTYANEGVNADVQLGENFALGYVPAGEYLVKAQVGKKSYVQPVKVVAGEIAFVLITTQE